MSTISRSLVDETIKATAVVGINAGYGTPNGKTGIDLIKFGELYKKIADVVMDKNGIYVGAVQSPVKVIYKTEWGCPDGGEDCIRLEADCNPNYSKIPSMKYVASWKEAFLLVIENLMEELNQTTVTVAFSDGKAVYLQRSKDEQKETSAASLV
jgi:hypothetical protein